jgi:nucleoside-diphosphate-sugar epimerase
MCRHFREDFDLTTRMARYHNVYGPLGTFEGGREKAPAAICRKVAAAKLAGRRDIEIWGDGQQTRSFCYVSDLVDGIIALAESGLHQPINIGNPDEFTLLELAQTVLEVAESRSEIVFEALPIDDPQVRQPDITRAKELLGWGPRVDLEQGLEATIAWFDDEQNRIAAPMYIDAPAIATAAE